MDLAFQIMEPVFNNFFNKYLSKESKRIVLSYHPLYFNFVYAAWNGELWFKIFANELNKKVASGETDYKKLFESMINLRKNSSNSLIRQYGPNVQKIGYSLS